jgi:A/G-specific adenine glycosylase
MYPTLGSTLHFTALPKIMTPTRFKNLIYTFYTKNKRSFPWRETTDPYRVLVSEIMLQQTQTDRVIPKYQAWLKNFPNFKNLAKANLQDVLKLWQGLGYNRRALALKRTSEVVTEKYNGTFPKTYEEILELPGIGPYTAGAILAFAFNIPHPIIETNIRNVFIHHFDDLNTSHKLLAPKGAALRRASRESRVSLVRTSLFPSHTSPSKHGMIHDKEILELVTKTLDKENPRDWYYALMDYGAMLKKQFGNANIRSKHYTKQTPFKGSNREIRSAVLRLLTVEPRTEKSILESVRLIYGGTNHNIPLILFNLEKEGFIKKVKDVYYIN